MPLWDVVCSKCGHEEEQLISRSNDETYACEECGGTTEKKPVQSTSFTLKGGGWAFDGYKGSSNRKFKG